MKTSSDWGDLLVVLVSIIALIVVGYYFEGFTALFAVWGVGIAASEFMDWFQHR